VTPRKQPISIYNSHGTRIPRKIVNKVKKHYRQGKNMEIRHDLEQMYPKLKEHSFRSVYEIFQFIVENNQHKAIDIDTEKFLPFDRAYNPISIKRLNEVCQIGRKTIDSLHPNLKPPMPIIFAIVGGIIGLAIIQNGPKYMREIGSYMEDLTGGPPPPPVVEPPPEVEMIAGPEVIPVVEVVPEVPSEALIGNTKIGKKNRKKTKEKIPKFDDNPDLTDSFVGIDPGSGYATTFTMDSGLAVAERGQIVA